MGKTHILLEREAFFATVLSIAYLLLNYKTNKNIEVVFCWSFQIKELTNDDKNHGVSLFIYRF